MVLIQCQIFNIITLPTNPPIHNYINRINSRLVFKIKVAYKLVLKTLETKKWFRSTKKLIDKTINGENVPNLEAQWSTKQFSRQSIPAKFWGIIEEIIPPGKRIEMMNELI